MQGATEVAVMLLDVLGYLEESPICVAYSGLRPGDAFPSSAALESMTPKYEHRKGWRSSISSIREFAELPGAAQDYVRGLEELIEVPVRWISVGPEREQMIRR